MIDPDEALRLVLQAAGSPRAETVGLLAGCGLRLAEDVRADRDYPAFSRAMMDGYAVRCADAGATVAIVAEVTAGQNPAITIHRGQCVEIMTGASCPPGSEAVVPKESAGRDGNCVTLPPRIAPGENIVRPGSECAAGALVLRAGQPVTPLAVAAMAAFGMGQVRVVRRPSLAVIATGAELAPPSAVPAPAQIRDSNGPMLVAMACQMDLAEPAHLRADDRLDAILAALRQTADRDIVLLSGGVSVGSRDLVPSALDRYGAEVIFRQVAQKPGKPLLFARKGEQLLFGLPGNPLACHLGFHRYVAAAIRQRQAEPPLPDAFRGQLAAPVRNSGSRTRFLLARAEASADVVTNWLVHPLPGVSSADIFTTARANCYLSLPPGDVEIAAGQIVPLEWICGVG